MPQTPIQQIQILLSNKRIDIQTLEKNLSEIKVQLEAVKASALAYEDCLDLLKAETVADIVKSRA